MTPAFIGIDLGTSGVRATAIDQRGEVLAEASTALPASTTAISSHAEQNPADWWEAVQTVLHDLLSRRHWEPVAIAIDGTSGTLLLCDETGTPCTPALMYNDARAITQARTLATIAPAESAVHSATSALAKLMWLDDQGLAECAAHALHQADWINGRLGGDFNTSDENNALKLGYDPVRRRWPEWLTDTIPARLLPHVVPVGQPIGSLRPDMLHDLGLQRAVRLIAGTTDSNAATLAAGITRSGEAVTSLGSTLAVKLLSDAPVFSAEYGVYSHRIGGRWLVGGASNSGGAVLRQYFSDSEIALLSQQLQPDIPTGLHYYPLPDVGERFPTNDPNMKPVLQPRPKSRATFLQAIFEGIAGIERDAYARLGTLGASPVKRILTSGGGAANTAWQRIRGSLIGVPVSAARHDAASYGAALIAAGRLL